MTLPVVFTVAEVARSLDVSEWFIRNEAKKGTVRPLRVGDRHNAPMRFTQADVDQLLESMRPPTPIPRRRRRRVA